jgi:hypothetical protein
MPRIEDEGHDGGGELPKIVRFAVRSANAVTHHVATTATECRLGGEREVALVLHTLLHAGLAPVVAAVADTGRSWVRRGYHGGVREGRRGDTPDREHCAGWSVCRTGRVDRA